MKFLVILGFHFGSTLMSFDTVTGKINRIPRAISDYEASAHPVERAFHALAILDRAEAARRPPSPEGTPTARAIWERSTHPTECIAPCRAMYGRAIREIRRSHGEAAADGIQILLEGAS